MQSENNRNLLKPSEVLDLQRAILNHCRLHSANNNSLARLEGKASANEERSQCQSTTLRAKKVCKIENQPSKTSYLVTIC
jgi:hypothetical protein